MVKRSHPIILTSNFAFLLLSASSLKICGSRNSDVNTSVDLIGSDGCPLTHEHMKGKVANVMSITRQGTLFYYHGDLSNLSATQTLNVFCAPCRFIIV